MQKYVDYEILMPKEQKLCCSISQGCKDQLLILKAILQDENAGKKFVWHGLIIRKLLTGCHTVG